MNAKSRNQNYEIKLRNQILIFYYKCYTNLFIIMNKLIKIEYHVEVNTKTYEIEDYWRKNYLRGKVNLFLQRFPEFVGYDVDIHGQQNGFCCSFNDYEIACAFKRLMTTIYNDYVSIRIFSTRQRRNSI